MKVRFKPYILLVLVSIALLITSIQSSIEAKKYKTQCINMFKAEWSSLYSMTDKVDRYFLSMDDSDVSDFNLYVNQICYSYYDKSIIGNFNRHLRSFLVDVYDMYFKVLSDDKYDYKKTKAALREMNSEFQAFCKRIADEKPDWILKERSKKYTDYINEIIEMKNKYEAKLNLIINEGNNRS